MKKKVAFLGKNLMARNQSVIESQDPSLALLRRQFERQRATLCASAERFDAWKESWEVRQQAIDLALEDLEARLSPSSTQQSQSPLRLI